MSYKTYANNYICWIKKYKESTIITHAGQESFEHFGFVNTPVYRGSTVLSETSKNSGTILKVFLW